MPPKLLQPENNQLAEKLAAAEATIQQQITEMQQQSTRIQHYDIQMTQHNNQMGEMAAKHHELQNLIATLQAQLPQPQEQQVQPQAGSSTAPDHPTHQQSYRTSITLEKYQLDKSANQWWISFMAFIQLMNIDATRAIGEFPFRAGEAVQSWWAQLEDIHKSTLDRVKNAFLDRFGPSSNSNMRLINISQHQYETVNQYFARIERELLDSRLEKTLIVEMVTKGLRKDVRIIVMPQNLTNLEQVRKAALLAENTLNLAKEDSPTCLIQSLSQSVSAQMDELNSNIIAATTAMKKTSIEEQRHHLPQQEQEPRPQQPIHQQHNNYSQYNHQRRQSPAHFQPSRNDQPAAARNYCQVCRGKSCHHNCT